MNPGSTVWGLMNETTGLLQDTTALSASPTIILQTSLTPLWCVNRHSAAREVIGDSIVSLRAYPFIMLWSYSIWGRLLCRMSQSNTCLYWQLLLAYMNLSVPPKLSPGVWSWTVWPYFSFLYISAPSWHKASNTISSWKFTASAGMNADLSALLLNLLTK